MHVVFEYLAPMIYWWVMFCVGWFGFVLSLFNYKLDKHTRLALFMGAVVCIDYSWKEFESIAEKCCNDVKEIKQ